LFLKEGKRGGGKIEESPGGEKEKKVRCGIMFAEGNEDTPIKDNRI